MRRPAQGEIPKIIMAATEAEAAALYDALLKFHDDNGFAEVEAICDAKHQETCAVQGGFRFG